MSQVVLVDDQDNEIGLEDKVAAHLGEGILHRAFTILIFNEKGETLVSQRSAGKMLWPLFWDSACASHPVSGEDYVTAGERRLSEELGFNCQLKVADRFQYKENYKNVGSENEVCTILVGEYNGEVYPVMTEVADYKWVSIGDLKNDMIANPDIYTIWFKTAFNRLIDQGRIIQED